MTRRDPHSITILAVEDDAMIREMLNLILSRAGFRILVAGGAEEALAASRSFPGRIDVLLSDYSMPGMNGLELASRLEVERPDMKPLIISGSSDVPAPKRFGFLP